MEYLLHLGTLICIYSIIAVSLDLLVGNLGIFSVAHASFFGLGAYVSAVLTTEHGISFVIGGIIGMALAAFVSLAVSIPSLRIHDDYFAIVTFGFSFILFSVFNNWMDITRGPLGIPGIPQPTIFGATIRSHSQFLLLSFGVATLVYFSVSRISASPFGRVLRAIREDEILAQSLGKNTLAFKMVSFAVSSALAALAGSLFAHYVTYVEPTSFTVMESILALSMVIVGGSGSRWGPLVGAGLLITFPEALRFIGMPTSVAANLRLVLYGGLLVFMMVFRPRGLVGHRAGHR